MLRDLRGIHEGDPAGQLWAKAMADTLLEAHRIRVARDDYNIAPVHLADAIEALSRRSRRSLSDEG